jgi:hypothetical protein
MIFRCASILFSLVHRYILLDSAGRAGRSPFSLRIFNSQELVKSTESVETNTLAYLRQAVALEELFGVA